MNRTKGNHSGEARFGIAEFGFLCLFGLGCAAEAKNTRFEVKDPAFRNSIQATSDALLEKIPATSYLITGWVELDPQNLKSGIKGEFEVDMRSFEVGPEPRQVKLRETVFNTAEFPLATFKADKLEHASVNELASGKPVVAKVGGVLTFRGVTVRQVVQVKGTYFQETEWTKRRSVGNLLKLAASFEVALATFKFILPDTLSGLVAPTFKVEVDIMGTDRLPGVTP